MIGMYRKSTMMSTCNDIDTLKPGVEVPKKPWITADILDVMEQRRILKTNNKEREY